MKKIIILSSESRKWEKEMVMTRRNIWLRKRRLTKFSFDKREKILDLGCGDGFDIQILGEMGVRDIVGIDISKKLLNQAKLRNPNVKFIYASCDAMPFKDNSFDCLLADSVLYHFVNNKKAIKEIARVIKQGGRLCFIESHDSILRRLLDFVTLLLVTNPFLKGRKQAYLAEKNAILSWKKNEKVFLRDLNKFGLQKKSLSYDLFSVVGQYGKRR